MQKTSVICVNYGGTTDTVACVKSLLRSKVPVQIVVVDTTPNDPDLQGYLSIAPDAILLRAEENVGFGRANNIGIDWVLAKNSCEFVFCLNNDAIIYPESVECLQNAMAAQPDVGIMTPRIAYLGDPAKLWYGGGEIDWRRASAFTPGFNGGADASLAMTERDVTFASGCALFIRRSTLEQLGGFDPRFFMYEEDVELCLRAREQGIRIRYIPTSLVLHRGQGSGRGDGEDYADFWSTKNEKLPFYAFHVIRNRLLNVYLHARGWQRIIVWIFFPLFLLRRIIPFLLGRRWDAVIAMCKGITDSWRSRRTLISDKHTS
jgi:GT2 family glycosyltransferase